MDRILAEPEALVSRSREAKNEGKIIVNVGVYLVHRRRVSRAGETLAVYTRCVKGASPDANWALVPNYATPTLAGPPCFRGYSGLSAEGFAKFKNFSATLKLV